MYGWEIKLSILVWLLLGSFGESTSRKGDLSDGLGNEPVCCGE